MNALGKFIADYIDAHGISMNELGERMGVSGSTISRHVRDNPPEPGLNFLDKLAQATGQDVTFLVNLYLGRSGDIPTDVLIKAREYAGLTEDGKDAVARLIRSFQTEKQR